MKVRLIKLGKPAFPEIRTLIDEYSKRLGAFVSFEVVEMKEAGFQLIKKPGEVVVFLDESGKTFSSQALAQKFQRWLDDPAVKSLTFVIGGPYGFDAVTKKSAEQLMRLSDLTLQGDIAWLVACEQIYRAFTILKKTPYHH